MRALRSAVVDDDLSKLVNLARSCRDAVSAVKLHSHILQTEHSHNRYLGNVLVEVFLRCDCLENALLVFRSIDHPSVYSHNLVIAASAKYGQTGNAKSLFDGMQKRDRATWNSLLQGLGRNGYMEEAMELAERMPCRNRLSWTVMVQGYAQYGHLDEAKLCFECMPEKDVVVWTVMLDAYASNGHVSGAKLFFDSMPERNEVSWNTLMNAYQHTEEAEEALTVFNFMPCWSLASLNSAMTLERRRSTSTAKLLHLFDRLPERDVVSWNALVCALSDRGCVEEARDVLELMPSQDQATWNAVLVGLVESGSSDEAKRFFEQRVALRNVVSWTALAKAYGCSQQVLERMPAWSLVTLNLMLSSLPSDQAALFFNQMPERSSVSWTVLHQANADLGHLEPCEEAFNKMPCWSTAACNVLIKASAETSGILRAREIFEEMPKRDVVSWTTLIQANAMNGETTEATNLFHKMPEHDTTSGNVMIQAEPCQQMFQAIQKRTFASWSSLTQGYIRSDRLEEAGTVLGAMPVRASVLETELLMAYARKGDCFHAKKLFSSLIERDSASWNAMIQGCAYNGQWRQGRELFTCMALEGVDADEKSFTGVLAACCYAGECEGGGWLFCSMMSDYGIEKPRLEHYCCMIEVIGRCKELKLAVELINFMPFWPDSVAWTSLLAACKAQGDTQLAEQVMETDCFKQAAPYILLSNSYTYI